MKENKTIVFIDGSNTYHAQKKLGWLIDWKKMIELISKNHEVEDLENSIKAHRDK